MENNSDLIGTIISLVIFLTILLLGFILYRKLMFSTPKRNSISKKHYFLRDRYKYKRTISYAEVDDVNSLKDYLSTLNFQAVSDDGSLWYLKNESDDFYLHLDYQDKILEITTFAESIFTMTKISVLLEQILNK